MSMNQSVPMNNSINSFQSLILSLQNYWADQNCALLQPFDMEVGAGTLHPATVLRALGSKHWRAAYVQPSRRPSDGRYGENPNRLGHYYQFQVILKPNPKNMQDLYLESLVAIGIDPELHDIRFVEDDWENPTVGAWGLGWEVWCDGMEVSQYTYFQQVGGIDVKPVSGELTYGLERLAMYVFGVDDVYSLPYNDPDSETPVTYGDVFHKNEVQQSTLNFEESDTEMLRRWFEDCESQSRRMSEKKLPLPAYEFALKASHVFNMIDARGVIGVNERQAYISRVRNIVRDAAENWIALETS